MSLNSNSMNGLRLSMNEFMDANYPSYTIVYDENFAEPEVFSSGAKWITPVYGPGPVDPTNPVKQIEFFLYCFSKGDAEGLELTEMLDTVIKSFVDATVPDGRKRIPFFVVDNGTRVQVSTIIASDIQLERAYRLGDSTSAQTIKMFLTWC